MVISPEEFQSPCIAAAVVGYDAVPDLYKIVILFMVGFNPQRFVVFNALITHDKVRCAFGVQTRLLSQPLIPNRLPEFSPGQRYLSMLASLVGKRHTRIYRYLVCET